MSKGLYRLNKELLRYEKIKEPFKKKFVRTIRNIIILCISGFLLNYFYVNYFVTAKEINLIQLKNQTITKYIELQDSLNQLQHLLSYYQEKDDEIYRPILELEPFPKEIKDAGFGGKEDKHSSNILNIPNTNIISLTTDLINEISSKLNVARKSYETIHETAMVKNKEIDCIPAIQPISVSDFYRISDYYGTRNVHPVTGALSVKHKGIDFIGPRGCNVYSTGNGTVKRVKRVRGYGKIVEIDHGFNYSSLYAHLDDYLVEEGQKILRGQPIGKLGNTGRTTGPHLHYEVRYKNYSVNPIYYYSNNITAEEYDKMVEKISKELKK